MSLTEYWQRESVEHKSARDPGHTRINYPPIRMVRMSESNILLQSVIFREERVWIRAIVSESSGAQFLYYKKSCGIREWKSVNGFPIQKKQLRLWDTIEKVWNIIWNILTVNLIEGWYPEKCLSLPWRRCCLVATGSSFIEPRVKAFEYLLKR
jgi:hypothetical protein